MHVLFMYLYELVAKSRAGEGSLRDCITGISRRSELIPGTTQNENSVR